MCDIILMRRTVEELGKIYGNLLINVNRPAILDMVNYFNNTVEAGNELQAGEIGYIKVL
jgi:hypothetical protein